MAIPSSNYQNLRDKQTDQMVQLLAADIDLISISPTVTAGAYHANDNVGGLQTLVGAMRVNAGTGLLQSVTVADKAMQNAQIGIYLFSTSPASGTYTNNVTFTMHDTDLNRCIGWVEVATSDYKSFVDNSVACIRNLSFPIKASAGTKSIYVLLRVTGTPTYAAATDLKLTFGILRD